MTASIDKQPTPEDERFEAFKERIREIQREEMEGQRPTVHLIGTDSFPPVDVEKLTNEDMEAYEKFLSQPPDEAMLDEFRKYQSSAAQAGPSRQHFAAYLANKISYLLNKNK